MSIDPDMAVRWGNKHLAEFASRRPWTYHTAASRNAPIGMRDWIEDATGSIVVENVGHLDGPLICAAVNKVFGQ